MKKLLLLLPFLISLSASSQTSVYHPFPDSNAVWNIVLSQACVNPSDYCDSLYSYIMIGDTVIASTSYHKISVPIVQMSATGGTCSGCTGLFPGRDAGYIRQDTAVKKVYYVESGSNVEQLLYDFNMQVGDTVKGYIETICSQMSLYDRVVSIDSILIGNNYRKRWQLNWFYLIEGIGTTFGLLGYSDCGLIDAPWPYLTCFIQDDTVLYHPLPSYSCNIITGLKSSAFNFSSVSIFPNPFHSTATIQLPPSFSQAELKIYNVLGIEVKRHKIMDKTTVINRDGMADGIYFFRVVNEGGESVGGKFVVE